MVTSVLLAIGTVVFLVGIFVLFGLRRIEADPPHVGILTIWGERQPEIRKEGWHFFPLYPFWYGFVPVPIKKVGMDLKDETVRTPRDNAESLVPVALTFSPGCRKKEGEDEIDEESLIVYLNHGGKEGVSDILEDIVRERLREWAGSAHEGPKTWKQLRSAKGELIAMLLKAVLGDDLDPIPSDVPTGILLKYFTRPQIPPDDEEKVEWGDKWSKVSEALAEEDRYAIERAVAERRKILNQIRQGKGELNLPQLGIQLNRINVGEVKTLGKVADAAEKAEVERLEREAEIVETQHLILRMAELMAKSTDKPAGPGFTAEQALEAFQTERGKITKRVEEKKYTISPETHQMIADLPAAIGAEIFRILQGRSQ